MAMKMGVRLAALGGAVAVLALLLGRGPSPAEAQGPFVSIDPVGSVSAPVGAAHITGTLQCPEGASGFVWVRVQQWFRGTVVEGFGFLSVTCTGGVQEWEATVTPFFGGAFKPGLATARAELDFCGGSVCGFVSDLRSVRLRGSP
jgi:hypothetical protein